MSIIDEVLDRYDRKETTFEVKLPKGETFRFRHFVDADDFEAFVKGAGEFAGLIEKPPATFRGHMPKSKSVAINAFMISYLSVEPKIEQLHALKLAKRPEVFFHIINQIEGAKQAYEMDGAEEAITRGKDSSKGTPPAESS